jgi:hypothetical protein
MRRSRVRFPEAVPPPSSENSVPRCGLSLLGLQLRLSWPLASPQWHVRGCSRAAVSCAPERAAHATGCLPSKRRGYVRVPRSDPQIGVAENLHDHTDVYAVFEQDGCRRVASVVHADVANAGILEQEFPVVPVVAWVNGIAVRATEC